MSRSTQAGTHTRYAAKVPNAPRTPHRHLRVDAELWKRFSEAVATAGLDRSTVLRDFMRWYARYPKNAPRPQRPDLAPAHDAAAEPAGSDQDQTRP